MIMQEWTYRLSIRMQAVLISAIRGCDGAPKNDPSKSILWKLRWDILNPSGPEDMDPYKTKSFMGYTATLEKDTLEFLQSLDQYPFHFIMHLAHAAEIVGYKHPIDEIRVYWLLLYRHIIVDNIHCNVEFEDQMNYRLRDR